MAHGIEGQAPFNGLLQVLLSLATLRVGWLFCSTAFLVLTLRPRTTEQPPSETLLTPAAEGSRFWSVLYRQLRDQAQKLQTFLLLLSFQPVLASRPRRTTRAGAAEDPGAGGGGHRLAPPSICRQDSCRPTPGGARGGGAARLGTDEAMTTAKPSPLLSTVVTLRGATQGPGAARSCWRISRGQEEVSRPPELESWWGPPNLWSVNKRWLVGCHRPPLGQVLCRNDVSVHQMCSEFLLEVQLESRSPAEELGCTQMTTKMSICGRGLDEWNQSGWQIRCPHLLLLPPQSLP